MKSGFLIKLFVFCVLVVPLSLFAQTKVIKGVVTDSSGEPLIGVNIVEKGTKNGTITDFDGKFVLNVSPESKLKVSYVGFKTLNLNVSKKDFYDIVLETDSELLDEVVVVGYGTMKKSDLSGASQGIKSKQFEDQFMNSPEEALKGRIAGVKVTGGNAPGEGLSIQIRGTNSMLGGTEPLYVVDGFPIEPSVDAQGTGNTSPSQSSLNFINPSDIESIEVLKDASATAIYGARGANGVVLIQTKSGKSGKTQVSYTGGVGVSVVSKKIDLLDEQGYAEYMNQRELNRYYIQSEAVRLGYLAADKLEPISLPYDGVNKPLPSELAGTGTDWQDAVYRPAFNTNHSLKVSVGNDKTKFSVSGGISVSNGSIIETGFKRFTLSSSIDHKITKNLKLSTSLNLSKSDTKGGLTSTGDIFANRGVVTNALWCQPVYQLTDEPENDDLSELNDGAQFNNPYLLATLIDDEKGNFTLRNVNKLEYQIVKGLIATGTIAYSRITNERSQYFPIVSKRGEASEGIASLASNQNSKYMLEGRLNYTTKFGKFHNFSAMGAVSYEDVDFKSFYQKYSGFPNDALKFNNVSSAKEIYSPEDSYWTSQLLSYIFRANYNYRNRYLLTATFRVDGSSRGSYDNKYDFFPSLAASWRISEEPFMKSVDFISNLKLRASYGVTGNYPNVAYQSLSKMEYSKYPFDGVLDSGAYEANLGNPELSWEKTDQYNVGLDLGFFNNKLMLTIDAYYKLTRDLLQQVKIAPSTGFSTRLMNLGEVENKGIEFDINYKIFSKKNLEWSIYANGGVNKNKLLSLGNRDYIQGNNIGGVIANRFMVGQPLGVFYGLRQKGVFESWDQIRNSSDGIAQRDATPGEYIFENIHVDYVEDASGNLVPSEKQVINEEDYTVIGDPNPDFVYAFGTDFRYKGFDFSILFTGQVGGDIYWADYGVLTNMWRPYNMYAPAFENSWKAPLQYTVVDNNGNAHVFGSTGNTSSASYPRAMNWDKESTVVYQGDVTKIARYRNDVMNDAMLHDASFLKIQNITIGYTFNNIPKISSLRLSVSGTNLFTFTKYLGYDPEISSSLSPMMRSIDLGAYPAQRTITGSVQINF